MNDKQKFYCRSTVRNLIYKIVRFENSNKQIMAVAVAVAAMANGAPKLCHSYFSHHHKLLLKPTKKKLMSFPKFFDTQNLSSNATLKSLSSINASNSPREEETSITDSSNGFSPEDLNYLWKLGGGSVAGAAVIKYGSIIFPEITRPNIILALVMVSAPVIIAIVLLIKQSRLK
ncbi:hypothetical protein JCGZ_06119 [Jatropha curcas]|uniref:Uncharacterized protein n=1 Tax=Jatropha curcas TaxID=180498 RepID=A0A067KPX2_JATCU|nr:hypothetical protein JCGZ_06119 [Jatropha curcas]